MFDGSFQLMTTADHYFVICTQRFDYRALGSSRKLGVATEHLIDGSEKRIVMERLSKKSRPTIRPLSCCYHILTSSVFYFCQPHVRAVANFVCPDGKLISSIKLTHV